MSELLIYYEESKNKFCQNTEVEEDVFKGEYEYSNEDIKFEDKRSKIIGEIIDFSARVKKINMKFVYSVFGYLMENKYITSSQYN